MKTEKYEIDGIQQKNIYIYIYIYICKTESLCCTTKIKERLEISSRKLDISREHLLQR